MFRLLSRSLVVVVVALPLAACGSGKGSKAKVSQATTTTQSGPATTGTTQPPVSKPLTATSQQYGTSRYTVTVVVGTPSPATYPCSQGHVAGRFNVPFTLTIKNNGTSTAPEAGLGLILNDPQKVQTELVGIKLPQGPCVDFTLENNTIPAGQSTTYEGSASNVSKDAELDVSLKVAQGQNNPANDFIKVKLFQ